jgi:hypothetical protein
VDCWRKDPKESMEISDKQTEQLSSIMVAPHEQIIGQVRGIMAAIGENAGERKELKMRLERCFIDLRREFEVLCLEKIGEQMND